LKHINANAICEALNLPPVSKKREDKGTASKFQLAQYQLAYQNSLREQAQQQQNAIQAAQQEQVNQSALAAQQALKDLKLNKNKERSATGPEKPDKTSKEKCDRFTLTAVSPPEAEESANSEDQTHAQMPAEEQDIPPEKPLPPPPKVKGKASPAPIQQKMVQQNQLSNQQQVQQQQYQQQIQQQQYQQQQYQQQQYQLQQQQIQQQQLQQQLGKPSGKAPPAVPKKREDQKSVPIRNIQISESDIVPGVRIARNPEFIVPGVFLASQVPNPQLINQTGMQVHSGPKIMNYPELVQGNIYQTPAVYSQAQPSPK